MHTGGTLGSVGVNYLPVNAAPVVDELVVVTGARLNPQTAAATSAADREYQFPFRDAERDRYGSTGEQQSPLQAMKDRTAITVRWAAHDDNGDDLTYSLYLRGDGEHVWRLLKDRSQRRPIALTLR